MKYEHSYLNPKNWVLKGKDKDRLDANRRYYGESLERALADIDHDDKGLLKYKKEMLRIDLKYNRISQEGYERKVNDTVWAHTIEAASNKKEREDFNRRYEISKIELDRKFSKISDQEYQKQKATINDEPFVTVVKVHYDETGPTEGYFELDYNKQFVAKLVQSGYAGASEEMVVKDWFDTICKNIAKENGAIFPEQPETIEEFKHPTIGTRKTKAEDGKIEVQ